MIYPDDGDGDALRRVEEHSDMSRPMEVDFMVAVPSESAGLAISSTIADAGYAVSLEFDGDAKQWTCYCTKLMLLTYEAVVDAQAELDALSAPVGGYSDGWGTSGNADA